MTELQKEYRDKAEAEAARPAAEEFFGKALGRAIAALSEELRPYADERVAKVKLDFEIRGGYPRRTFHFWVLSVDYNLRGRSSWGETKLRMRADGSVNEENLFNAVAGYAYRKKREIDTRNGMAANAAILATLSPKVAKYLQPTKTEGYFDFTLETSDGLSISKSVTAEQAQRLAPVVDYFARSFLAALYPDRDGNESASVVSIHEAR